MGFPPPSQDSSVGGCDIQGLVCGQETQMRLGKCQPPTASLPINHSAIWQGTPLTRNTGLTVWELGSSPSSTPKLAGWCRVHGSPPGASSSYWYETFKVESELEKGVLGGGLMEQWLRAQPWDPAHLGPLLTLPFANSGAPSSWFNLPVPQGPQLQNKHNSSTYSTRRLEGLRTKPTMRYAFHKC